MKTLGNILLSILFVFLFTVDAHSDASPSKWLMLDADSKERIRSLIKSDVEGRRGFSTAEEDRLNTAMVQSEREKENSAYKAAIEAATSDYQRAKKRSDNLTAQFQTMAYDFEESTKNLNNLRASITNIDNQITRYQQDIRAQQRALEKSLKTTKLGEAIVAVIYTRGFMDSAHKLESQADQASAPLIAEHMGVYIQSFSSVINNVLSKDFIRAVKEGTAKWDREEPYLIALSKGAKGTTYLRIKRYELYPFQAPEKGRVKKAPKSLQSKTTVISSIGKLKSLLDKNGLSVESQDIDTIKSMINESDLVNKQAKANQREQLISFKERLEYLKQKITTAQNDRKAMSVMYKEKEVRLAQMKDELSVLKLKKESAELAFQNAQAVLLEKKRVHESIVIKSSVVIVKRSETPAKASSDAVIEELKDVLNDARLQHYSSTTDVVNGKLVAESDDHAITKASIIAVRPLSFINEGDSIRVKIAFRVRTVLDEKKQGTLAKRPKQKPTQTIPAKKRPTPPTPPPKKEPKPATAKKKPPAPTKRTKVAKLTKKPLPKPSPKPAAKTIAPKMKAKALDFQFELKKVSRAGKKIVFQVASTNRADYVQYLAVYDLDSRYAESSISGSNKKAAPIVVQKVYLYEGKKKTASIDAYRGIPVKPGKTILVQLIFKPKTRARISKLKFVPQVATKSFIGTYSWQSKEIPFNNLKVP